MIVCKNCGQRNGDADTFCGSCGKFLEFYGERVDAGTEPPEPTAAADEPIEPAPADGSSRDPGLIGRVRHAVGIGPDDAAEPPRPAAPGTEPLPGPEPVPEPSRVPAPEPEPTPRPEPSPRPAPESVSEAAPRASIAPTPPTVPEPVVEPEPEPPPPEPTPEPPPPTVRRGGPSRRATVSLSEAGETAAAPGALPPVSGSPDHDATASVEQPPPARPGTPSPRPEPAADEPQARPPTAVRPEPLRAADPETRPVDGQPESRRPTDELRAPRPGPRPPEREGRTAQVGDRICANCGEPNEPNRRFCRRCGASVAESAVVAPERTSWWRRLFGRGRRQEQERYAAGQRLASMRQGARPAGGARIRPMRLLTTLFVVFVAAGVIAGVAIPSVRSAATDVVDQVRRMVAPRFERSHPIAARSSDELPDHGASLLVDTYRNTHWAAGGTTPSVTITFEEAEELGVVFVHNGSAKDYTASRRAAELEFVYEDGTVRTFELKDEPDPQRLDVNGPAAETFEIRIVETSGPDDQPVVLSEIEFLMKR